MTTAPAHEETDLPRFWWWGFIPFAVLSVIHVGARAAGAEDLAAPTKLTLMPLLGVAALWGLRSAGVRSAGFRGAGFRGAGLSAGLLPTALLFGALAFSWLGDGAATFAPFAPELPVMLGSFGIAHLCYIWLMARYVADRRFPLWALAYPVWWVLMLVVLWPTLGSLSFAVAAYGIVLAGTAATASRCGPVVAAGGVLFLASDTILSFRLFMPEAMPDWTSAMVMLTYCAGQGLIVAGVLKRLRPARRAVTLPAGSAAGSSTRP